jgi:hypothetical protein
VQSHPDLSEALLKNQVFVDSLPWFVGYFVVLLAGLLLVTWRMTGKPSR